MKVFSNPVKLPPFLKPDHLGITGSTLCLIHCLATPLFLLSADAGGSLLRIGPLNLDYAFILLAALAVYYATKHTDSLGIKVALWGFLALFSVGLVLEKTSQTVAYLGYFASVGLLVTHLVNLLKHKNHFKGVQKSTEPL